MRGRGPGRPRPRGHAHRGPLGLVPVRAEQVARHPDAPARRCRAWCCGTGRSGVRAPSAWRWWPWSGGCRWRPRCGRDPLYAWIGTPERRFGVLTWALCALAMVVGSSLDPRRHGRDARPRRAGGRRRGGRGRHRRGPGLGAPPPRRCQPPVRLVRLARLPRCGHRPPPPHRPGRGPHLPTHSLRGSTPDPVADPRRFGWGRGRRGDAGGRLPGVGRRAAWVGLAAAAVMTARAHAGSVSPPLGPTRAARGGRGPGPAAVAVVALTPVGGRLSSLTTRRPPVGGAGSTSGGWRPG